MSHRGRTGTKKISTVIPHGCQSSRLLYHSLLSASKAASLIRVGSQIDAHAKACVCSFVLFRPSQGVHATSCYFLRHTLHMWHQVVFFSAHALLSPLNTPFHTLQHLLFTRWFFPPETRTWAYERVVDLDVVMCTIETMNEGYSDCSD